jgi:hypothetical protein
MESETAAKCLDQGRKLLLVLAMRPAAYPPDLSSRVLAHRLHAPKGY